MKEVIKLWCEWDICQDEVIFASEEAARRWATDMLKSVGFEESYDELEAEHLIGLQYVTVIK